MTSWEDDMIECLDSRFVHRKLCQRCRHSLPIQCSPFENNREWQQVCMSGRLDGDTKESPRKDEPGGLSQSEGGGREAWCNDRTSVSCSVSVSGFGAILRFRNLCRRVSMRWPSLYLLITDSLLDHMWRSTTTGYRLLVDWRIDNGPSWDITLCTTADNPPNWSVVSNSWDEWERSCDLCFRPRMSNFQTWMLSFKTLNNCETASKGNEVWSQCSELPTCTWEREENQWPWIVTVQVCIGGWPTSTKVAIHFVSKSLANCITGYSGLKYEVHALHWVPHSAFFVHLSSCICQQVCQN